MEKIEAIRLSELYPFSGNPFRVNEDAELEALTESVREYGVITPLLVRPREEGGYEIIAGHRRMRACEKAGIETVPAFVREMDRDSAVIAMVDSNLQREHILPSERAFAYRLKLEAIRHQGKASPQVAEKLSVDLVGNSDGVSGDTVGRYIRLTNLSRELLQLVDDGKIALSPAVALSYLTEKEQADLAQTIASEDCTPSYAQAVRMKKLSQEGRLDMDAIFSIMTEVKGNQKEYLKLPAEKYDRYLRRFPSPQQKEDFIMKALDYYSKYLERQRGRDR